MNEQSHQQQQQQIEQLLQWVLTPDQHGSIKSRICKHIELKYLGDNFGFGGIWHRKENDFSESGGDDDDDDGVLLSLDLERFALNYRVALHTEFGKTVLHLLKHAKPLRALRRMVQTEAEDDDAAAAAVASNDGGAENFSIHAILFYLFLLHEHHKGGASFYHPYISMLPRLRQMDNIPLFFSDDSGLLEELEGTNLLIGIRSIRDKLTRIHGILFPALKTLAPQYFQDGKFTLHDFVWAYAVVWSRVFPVKYKVHDEESEETIPTLLPLIDILNHQHGAKLTYYTDMNNKVFSLKSQKPFCAIPNGEQVCNNYGAKSNDSFLLAYGFIIEDNAADTLYVQIKFSDGESDLALHKSTLLEQFELPLGYYISTTSGIPDQLFLAMRICVMTEHEAYFFHADSEESLQHPICAANEIKTFKLLKDMLQSKLLRIRGTIDEDENLLREHHNSTNILSRNMFNVVVYRLGQKRILRNAITQVVERETKYLSSEQYPFISPISTQENISKIKRDDACGAIQEWIESNDQCNERLAFSIVKLSDEDELHVDQYGLLFERPVSYGSTLLSLDFDIVISTYSIEKSQFG